MAISLSLTAHADAQAGKLKQCKRLPSLAETIMNNRQDGVDMVDMYEIDSKSMA